MYLIAGRGRKSTGSSKLPNSHGDLAASVTPPAPLEPHTQDDIEVGIGIDGLDIEHGGFDDVDAGFDDTDLNDPDLLGELEAMRREMGHCEPPSAASGAERHKRTSKPHTVAPGQGALDESSPVKLDHEEEDRAVESVTVTEDDMNDPGLLAELAKYSSSPAPAEQPRDNQTEVAAHPPERTITAAAEPTVQNGSSGVTVEALKKQHQELKRLALAAKRQGDMNQAREMLVQMKSIQTSIDQAQSGMPVSSGTPAFETPRIQQQPGNSVGTSTKRQQPSNEPQLQGTTVPGPLNIHPAPAASASAPRKPPRSHVPPTAQKKAAPGPKQSHKSTRVAPSTLEDIELQNSEFGELATSFAAMKRKLEIQISQATNLAAYFLKTGEKTLALDFHRLKKRSAADLAAVVSFEANGRRLPPPFLHREVQWTMPVEQRRDISVSELQVVVKRIFSDGDLAATLGGKSDFYVQWESGWPRDKNSKGYTRTIKYNEFESSGGDVDVGYTHNIEFVDRHFMRPLQRWIERGKLTVELHKYLGILWGSQLVGRASIPLLELRTKSEVSKLVEIKATSDGAGRTGKPFLGGPIYVDVAARLRLPLTNKAELVAQSERWIYLDNQDTGGNDQAQTQPQFQSQPAAAAAAHELPLQKQTGLNVKGSSAANGDNVSEHRQTADPAQQAESASANATDEANKPQTQSVDDIAEQMNSIETIVSNAVLEMELQLIPERMRNTSDKEHASALQELETAIKLRMSVVAAQVGAGTLTIQDYIDSVTRELQLATQWALTAKKGGRKDLALRALKRVKAMRNELEEMKAAMSAE
ncbi:hypothetical protein IW140_000580 [Coemansia sp. RSA 1813]|nr:hypothetical protein EV178_002689 [Coemansia sp. RSA 1646]KAJ1774049.1 hypothetical protein LPJ74_000148 [Coemansia sp. RSA 1843]KAJ2092561.1 hypothetical protein IW138_000999 [Coemansia sp. RSA 986]KAJ2216745.1 hypothetical protein EV179_001035 [Coemansia sp. RSA 487]KAJ2572817.1 hypothetical protein IW140_000580 [Coemansia sp. RSA 1813]